MSNIQLPQISFFFERTPRRLIRLGSSAAITVPPAFEQSLLTLGDRRVLAMVLRNYLIYTPLPFALEPKYQLLNLAMTALEALAVLDNSEEVKEARKKLKDLEDRWEREEATP